MVSINDKSIIWTLMNTHSHIDTHRRASHFGINRSRSTWINRIDRTQCVASTGQFGPVQQRGGRECGCPAVVGVGQVPLSAHMTEDHLPHNLLRLGRNRRGSKGCPECFLSTLGAKGLLLHLSHRAMCVAHCGTPP